MMWMTSVVQGRENPQYLSFIFQVWHLTQRLMGAVVQSERVPVDGAGRCRCFLCGGGAAAGLPPLPGVH